MTKPDPRRNAYRPDLADAALRGDVEAARYVEGQSARIATPRAQLWETAACDAAASMLLLGERVRVFEQKAGVAWLQSEWDGYVGYADALSVAPPGPPPTHRICVTRAHVYPEPSVKAPPQGALPFCAEVTAQDTVQNRFQQTELGWIFAAHLRPLDQYAQDWVGQAETLIGAPYLWGGKSAEGIDCSGLIQLSLRAAGVEAPRDSDMQAAQLGRALPPDAPLQRGDLIFWRGHVGVMADAQTLLHANAWAMRTIKEPFAQARARIAAQEYGEPTAIKRLET